MKTRIILATVVFLALACAPDSDDPKEVQCAYAANKVCGMSNIGDGQRICREDLFRECMGIAK